MCLTLKWTKAQVWLVAGRSALDSPDDTATGVTQSRISGNGKRKPSPKGCGHLNSSNVNTYSNFLGTCRHRAFHQAEESSRSPVAADFGGDGSVVVAVVGDGVARSSGG